MVAILDYKIGNLGSIQNMLKKIGADFVVSSDPKKILLADRLILPGVGAFDRAMTNLRETGLHQTLNTFANESKKPVLGLCLGMQLLTQGSDEGNEPGLGWIQGTTKKFNFSDKSIKVPHMGWNKVNTQSAHPLFKGLEDTNRFYFVHSFYVECEDKESLGKTHYGMDFTSAVFKENIMGVQFHPEKSHQYGLKLLNNFCFEVR